MPKYTLEQLTKERNLDEKAFSKTSELSLYSPMEAHVKWAFNHIYSVPYPEVRDSSHSVPYPDAKKPLEIKNIAARMHHGIQHVTRAAMYVPVIANLYRKYGDKAALALTEEKLKLLQIAVLFHDSARLNEDKDLWDTQSGDLLYYYLTKVLKVSADEAEELADAVANKERESDSEKNIYEKIIHDADCLEIIRARPHFDANYLDFYNDYADDNNAAFAEMAQLIREVRSIIEIQKDGYKRVSNNEKKYFETEEAYHRIKVTLTKEDKKEDKKPEEKKSLLTVLDIIDPKDHYQIIPKLASKLLNTDELKAPLLKDYTPKSRDIFLRGIANPSAIRKKEIKSPQTEKTRPLESMASVELRKSLRKKGIRTRTSKNDALNKDGNPWRSISTEGSFTAAGYFGELDLSLLDEAHAIDKGTGRHKKSEFEFKMQNPLLLEEKKKQVSELNRLLDMGGSSVTFGKSISTHTEFIYHIKPDSFKGVYFTHDPVLFHHDMSSQETYYAKHRFSPILQGIFLQKEYEKYTGTKLPLYEYSSFHNYFVEKTYNDDDIVAMWREMFVAYIEKAYKEKKDSLIAEKSLDHLKIQSMYFIRDNDKKYFAGHFPGDANYNDELKHKVNEALEAARKELEEKCSAVLQKEILEIIESKPILLLDQPYINYLIGYPILLDNKIIHQSVEKILNSEDMNANLKSLFYEVLGKYNNWTCTPDKNWKTLEDIYYLLKKTGCSRALEIKDKIFTAFKISLSEDISKDDSNIRYYLRYYLKIAKKFHFTSEAIPLIYNTYLNINDINNIQKFWLAVRDLHKNKILDIPLAVQLSDILLKKLLSATYLVEQISFYVCPLIAIFEEYSIPLKKHKFSLKEILFAEDRKVHIGYFQGILKLSRNDIELFEFILNRFDWEESIIGDFCDLKYRMNYSAQKALGKYFTTAHQEILDKFFMDYLLKHQIKYFVTQVFGYSQNDYEDQMIFKNLVSDIEKNIGHYIFNEHIYIKLIEEIKSAIHFPRKDELLDFVDDFRKKYQVTNVTEFKKLPKELAQKTEDKKTMTSQMPNKSLYQCRRQLEKLKEEKNVDLELIKDIFDNIVLKIAGHESLKLPHINSFYDLDHFLQCSKLLNEYKNVISVDIQKQVIIAFFQSYPDKKIIDLPDNRLGVNLLSCTVFYKDDPAFLKILINNLYYCSGNNKISKYYNMISDHLGIYFTAQHKKILEEALSDYAIKIINAFYKEVHWARMSPDELFENHCHTIEKMGTYILKEEIYQLLLHKTHTFKTFHKQKELLQFLNSFRNKMHKKTSKLSGKEFKEKALEKLSEKQTSDIMSCRQLLNDLFLGNEYLPQYEFDPYFLREEARKYLNTQLDEHIPRKITYFINKLRSNKEMEEKDFVSFHDDLNSIQDDKMYNTLVYCINFIAREIYHSYQNEIEHSVNKIKKNSTVDEKAEQKKNIGLLNVYLLNKGVLLPIRNFIGYNFPCPRHDDNDVFKYQVPLGINALRLTNKLPREGQYCGLDLSKHLYPKHHEKTIKEIPLRRGIKNKDDYAPFNKIPPPVESRDPTYLATNGKKFLFIKGKSFGHSYDSIMASKIATFVSKKHFASERLLTNQLTGFKQIPEHQISFTNVGIHEIKRDMIVEEKRVYLGTGIIGEVLNFVHEPYRTAHDYGFSTAVWLPACSLSKINFDDCSMTNPLLKKDYELNNLIKGLYYNLPHVILDPRFIQEMLYTRLKLSLLTKELNNGFALKASNDVEIQKQLTDEATNRTKIAFELFLENKHSTDFLHKNPNILNTILEESLNYTREHFDEPMLRKMNDSLQVRFKEIHDKIAKKLAIKLPLMLEKEQKKKPIIARVQSITFLQKLKSKFPTSSTKEKDNKNPPNKNLWNHFFSSSTEPTSYSSMTLFIDEKGSLVLKFENETDSKSFAKEVKGIIPSDYRKGPQFAENKAGEIPVRLNEHCLSFPTYKSQANEFTINLVTSEVRDAFIKKLNIHKITNKTFKDGQVGITYWGINGDKKNIPIFTIYNNSKQNTAIYFDKALFTKENEFIKTQGGQMTLGEDALIASIRKKY